MERESELHVLIQKLQMDQMAQLREWMTEAEDRISRSDLLF